MVLSVPCLSAVLLILSICTVNSFTVTMRLKRSSRTALRATSRRDWLVASTALILVPATAAHADVSDGNTLPQGMLQFNRAIRLKKDIKVRK